MFMLDERGDEGRLCWRREIWWARRAPSDAERTAVRASRVVLSLELMMCKEMLVGSLGVQMDGCTLCVSTCFTEL